MGSELSCGITPPILDNMNCFTKEIYHVLEQNINDDGGILQKYKDPRVLLMNVNDYKNMKILLNESWKISPQDTLRIMFFTRDINGGRGNKFIFREMCNWLLKTHPEEMKRLFIHIPFFGTWKDLFNIFVGTEIEEIVLKYFVNKLQKNFNYLCSNNLELIDWGVVKYAPTEGSSLDKKYQIVSKIINLLKITKEVYRKKYIRPLRRLNPSVEEYMCGGRWSEIDYSKLNSGSFKKYKKSFIKHDLERFSKYMIGYQPIRSNHIELFDMINSYINFALPKSINRSFCLEKKWNEYINTHKKLNNMLCVLDISESMFSKITNTKYSSIDVCLGIGILSSLLKSPTSPFFRKWLSFSQYPILESFEGEDLYDILKNIDYTKWSNSCDIEYIFTYVLDQLKSYNVNNQDVPKYILVITDINFSFCVENFEEVDWKKLKEEYNDNGYEIPILIFWDTTSHSSKIPSIYQNDSSDEYYCIVIDGYDTDIINKLINGDVVPPFKIMKNILDSERYALIE